MKQYLEANPGTARIVDEQTITTVIADLSKVNEDVDGERFQLLNAFETPRLVYDPARKIFVMQDVPKAQSLHAQPSSKTAMLRDRFLLVQQRIQRNEMFTRPLIASTTRSFIELTTVDALMGGNGGSHWILGMLCEVEEGRFYLEDLNGSVPLDLSRAITQPGMFTENCIVLAEGEMIDGQFWVKMMGFPPPQQRQEAIDAIGTYDLFKTGISSQQWAKIEELQTEAHDAMFVVLSDCHLDKPQVNMALT